MSLPQCILESLRLQESSAVGLSERTVFKLRSVERICLIAFLLNTALKKPFLIDKAFQSPLTWSLGKGVMGQFRLKEKRAIAIEC